MFVCKLKLRQKKWWKFSKCFPGRCLKLKLKENEVRDFFFTGFVPTGWAHVDWKIQSHGLKGKSEIWIYCEKEMFCKSQRKVLGVGYPVSWAPCCEWIKGWVPFCKWTRNILSRTLGGSFTCVYTRGPWAVEYLAKLRRMLKIFSKSFKAMILGFDFHLSPFTYPFIGI